MKLHQTINFFLLVCGVCACGQIGDHSHKEAQTMKSDIIKNQIVRQAFEAWQKADTDSWLLLFANNAELFDDGHPRDFHKFSKEAIGHERFLSIDRISEKGTRISGRFHSDTWGDFKTYFQFHMDGQGKIYKLDIGQTDY
jgi:hypothetical protein